MVLKKLVDLIFKPEKITANETMLIPPDQVAEIESKIGYHFRDHSLLIQALKHRSILNVTHEDRIFSNERLEFLGDAVVNMVVTHFLYITFPDIEEGMLSKKKAILVSREVLAEVAKELQLGKYVLLTHGEEKTGGRKRVSILANLYEALVGALFLDGGFEPASHFIEKSLLSQYHRYIGKREYTNYKSKLLEYAQKNHIGLPEYRVVREEGPDHNKTFYVEVLLNEKVLGEGQGKSKKQAEQHAAENALKKIHSENV